MMLHKPVDGGRFGAVVGFPSHLGNRPDRPVKPNDSAPSGELLRPWLLRVAINESRNAIRSRNRALTRDTAYEKTRQEAAAEFEPESSQQLEAARRALDKIKEPMRSCLLLRQQGLSYREIAQTLSVKENYVGSLVARARKEFTRTYGKIGAKP